MIKSSLQTIINNLLHPQKCFNNNKTIFVGIDDTSADNEAVSTISSFDTFGFSILILLSYELLFGRGFSRGLGLRKLLFGRGFEVAKAIVNAAGEEVTKQSQVYVKSNGEVRAGNVAVTDAGKLSAEIIIHAVGPVWNDESREINDIENELEVVVVNALKEAESRELVSVSFPAISSGIYGCPTDVCANIMFSSMKSYLKKKEKSSIKLIRIVVNSTRKAATFCKTILDTFEHVIYTNS
eukprot:gene18073-19882_t